MSSIVPPAQSLEKWLSEFKLLLNSDVNSDVMECLFFHLVDLKVFEKIASNEWRLKNCPGKSKEPLNNLLNATLQKYSKTPEGFAIGYFLAQSSVPSLPEFLTRKNNKSNVSKGKAHLSKSSDLSNLQIVKKYGKQVEEFMEFEKLCTEKLLGPNTTKIKARKIFNYILPKIQKKVTPRPWEQLSRRRHKK